MLPVLWQVQRPNVIDQGREHASGNKNFILENKAECSCRPCQVILGLYWVQLIPSLLYQTSPQFLYGLLDQPPITQMQFLYTTDENHIRSCQVVASVNCFQIAIF